MDAILASAKAGAEARFSHAQGCDGTRTIKHIDPENGVITKEKVPCQMCAQGMRWFMNLPVDVLAQVLEEPKVQAATFQMATLIIESTFERGTHNSKRAQRDLICGMHLLKYYQDELGGKLPREFSEQA